MEAGWFASRKLTGERPTAPPPQGRPGSRAGHWARRRLPPARAAAPNCPLSSRGGGERTRRSRPGGAAGRAAGPPRDDAGSPRLLQRRAATQSRHGQLGTDPEGMLGAAGGSKPAVLGWQAAPPSRR